MEKGIKITLKNGNIEHYDPCEEIIIDNGAHQYKVQVDDIEKIESYIVEETFPADSKQTS